jgi:hypothetical protein
MTIACITSGLESNLRRLTEVMNYNIHNLESGIERSPSDRNVVTYGVPKNMSLIKKMGSFFNRKQSSSECFEDVPVFLLENFEINNLSTILLSVTCSV